MTMERILVTRTDRLGDVVLSTPVARHLRKLYPDAYIAFMVKPGNRDIVEDNPDINEVIIYDKEGAQKGFVGTVLFAWELRKKRFDTAIILHPTNRSHIVAFLAGIPERVGYDKRLPFLLTKRAPHIKQEGAKHEIDYNFDLLALAGVDVTLYDRMPYMSTSDADKKMVDAVIKDNGLTGELVAMHVGASCRSKRWPTGRFAEVADRISKEFGARVIFVGGNESEGMSSSVVSLMKEEPVDLTGGLLLGEFAEFLSRCRLLISNDSGPVHVAVAVGTPVIAVFGRKDAGLSPRRWGPVGAGDTVLHKDVGCERCLAHECERDFACIKAVTVDEVMSSVSKVLGV
ncbi:MAG: lipopolysaccharide heptosyltransferase II [Candidatus Omnitrophica bacterium]|nr:lipopolysaccharide heptosyltransferase II [Candidatus Omnitrophota bacterium]MDD5487612.1 lipopolysaccharide heptosyltransferase II [Candidatus Omnitrophota bacterium]